MFSLSEAAKLSRQSKSTIWRAIKAGRLSASRTDTGDYAIEPSELHRVFPLGTTMDRAAPVSVKCDATASERAEMVLLQSQIDHLRQMGEMLRSELEDVKRDREDVRKDRDAWRGQAQAGTLLLTNSSPAAPARPLGWLRRLVG